MEYVEPLRTKAEIEAMKEALGKQSARNRFLFIFGINTGLRISDILSLRVRDLRTSRVFIEQKTGKGRPLELESFSDELRAEINAYIRGKKEDDFLFPSRKGDTAISRIQAHRILSTTAESIGISNFSNHSMRKTYGYFYYKQNGRLDYLRQLFNHASDTVTLRYIGINTKEINETLQAFYI